MVTDQRKAYLYGGAAVLCWSTVATAFKLSLGYLSPAQLLLGAALTSWLFLVLYLVATGRATLLSVVTANDWLKSLAYGAINPTLYYLVLFQAYDLLPAQEAQALNYSWALTMTLLSVPLLGHRLLKAELVAALVCYFGVVVIATRGRPLALEFESLQGVLLALLSTLLWAFYWILNTRDRRDPVLALFMNFSCAMPLIFVYCAMTGELSSIDWQGLPGAVYVGLFEMGLTFLLWLQAMRLTISTARIANLIFLSPFMSLLLIYLLLGESILPSTLVGLGLIIGGLLLQQRAAKGGGSPQAPK